MEIRRPEDFVREITRRIAYVRRAAGVTQEHAARRLGCALKNWQRLEAGQNLTLHTLARVAEALGVSPWVLLQPEGTGTSVVPLAANPPTKVPARPRPRGGKTKRPARTATR